MDPIANNIKHIIAIASGKGGVGKSTTAVNLAIALVQEGYKVGLLDADIYGPNIPTMFGMQGQKPLAAENQKMTPITSYGVRTMSIGYLLDSAKQPMIWRGPMVSGALMQLLQDTDWGELDYLLVDLPPGTGDIHLTLVQKFPLQGAVIVTTPQDIALEDVNKAIMMFNRTKVPILGVVENMSYYHCPTCGHEDPIFGEGGANKLKNEFNIDFIGKIPLQTLIRQQIGEGRPPAIANPESELAKSYRAIALEIIRNLNQSLAKKAAFPKIVVS